MCNETLKSTRNAFAKYSLRRDILNALLSKVDFIVINNNLLVNPKGED